MIHISFTRQTVLVGVVLLFAPFGGKLVLGGELPTEQALWPDGQMPHTLTLNAPESMRNIALPPGSPSGLNRVYRNVSKPTYRIFHAPRKKSIGVGLVICPGGGYREVWLDREGNDLAIRLQQHGITSLVLKYRTNGVTGGSLLDGPWKAYLPAVTADAAQAIRTLRQKAGDLGVDPERIGICGFSAGGNLALLSALGTRCPATKSHDDSAPNFAGLFYPWLREEYEPAVRAHGKTIPPLFIINGAPDTVTPAQRLVKLYASLLDEGVKTELHIFGKGQHGFDLGTGRLQSAAHWPDLFVAWLKDAGIAEKPE